MRARFVLGERTLSAPRRSCYHHPSYRVCKSSMDPTLRILSVARGDTPADCVLTGGRVVNTFTGEIERADIAIADGRIAGVGERYAGVRRIDLAGAYVAPGLIDAHVHIES